jgi:hypothetical protein
MVACSRRQLTLTKAGCARLFVSANGPVAPDPWEGRAACRGCPIGSANATGQPPNPLLEIKESLSRICSRCGRTPERLIWNTLCPSCDNRQREAVRGRNAKGNRPKLADLLHPAHLVVSVGSTMRTIHKPAVLSLSEVIIQAAKAVNGPAVFARPRVTWDAEVLTSKGWTSCRQSEFILTSGSGAFVPHPRLRRPPALIPAQQLELSL